MAERKVVIKKYSDRRLYDTAARTYVNLDDVARMIRDGFDVEVLDARTGKNITRVILTQIIMEDTRDGESGLPLKLLRQMVVASDRATHDFVSWYLDTALDLYRKAGSAVRTGVAEARSAVVNPFDFVRHLVGGAPNAPAHDDSEIEQLRREVQELKAQLLRRTRKRKSS